MPSDAVAQGLESGSLIIDVIGLGQFDEQPRTAAREGQCADAIVHCGTEKGWSVVGQAVQNSLAVVPEVRP